MLIPMADHKEYLPPTHFINKHEEIITILRNCSIRVNTALIYVYVNRVLQFLQKKGIHYVIINTCS